MSQQSAYRHILKATSIFGSVQVFNILISLIRSKFIAVFTGVTGIGIIGLLTSVINTIWCFTNFGIETSAVKNISTVQDNNQKLARETSILKRIAWISGILGSVIMIIFSPVLSKITFGNYEFTWAFILLSITLLFKQLTVSSIVVLQGLQKIKYLAKANLYGNLIGLLLSIPLYYFFGIDAIAPSIILSSIAAFIGAKFYESKLKINAVKLSNKEALTEGKKMLTLGFSLSFTGLLTTFSAYLLQIFITNVDDIVQVGLYTAGFTIVNTYAGVIFTAMASDYYPRLTKIIENNNLVKELVIQQSTFAVLILTPVIVIFLLFSPSIIRLLYSKEFLPIVPFVCWAILAVIIKSVSWSMGYVLLAKGDSKLFIKTSVFFNSIFLLMNVLGYFYYGLEGLGIVFLLYYFIHFLALKVIIRKKYDIQFEFTFYKLLISCFAICALAFICLKIENNYLKNVVLLILILFSTLYSIKELNQRIDFKTFFSKK